MVVIGGSARARGSKMTSCSRSRSRCGGQHGDNMPGGGVFEYYRRLACGWAGGTLPAIAPAEDVVLRASLGTTTLHSISGRQYVVDARGCAAVAAGDADPFVRTGWQRVEQAQDALVSDD